VTKLVSGRGFLFGPFSSALGILFTSTNQNFVAAGDMSSSRAFHSATRLGNGQVLIAGGANVATFLQGTKLITSVTPLASAELFDPTTLGFTNTGKMTIARSWHTATILGNGNVLIVGGVDVNGNVLSSAEQYH